MVTLRNQNRELFKFATIIRCVPHLDVITAIEETVLRILEDRADELRWKLWQALRKTKSSKPKHYERKDDIARPTGEIDGIGGDGKTMVEILEEKLSSLISDRR